MVLNVAESVYADYERGKRDISAIQLMRLCEYYDLKMDTFFSSASPLAQKEQTEIKPERQEPERPVRRTAQTKAKRSKGQKTKKASSLRFSGTRSTPSEYKEGSQEERLMSLLTNIVVENTMREIDDQAKLARSPGGYHYEGKKACVVCGMVVSGELSWYDRNGLKCIHCQKALDAGIVPYWVTKSRDSFYTEIQLELNFNMVVKTRKAFEKAGLLKSRIIAKADGTGKHFVLYLRSDNCDFLPPHKKLRVGGPVKEVNKDGLEEYVLSYPWYYFVDPLDHLKDYGICNYLSFVPQTGKKDDKDDIDTSSAG